MKYDLYSQRGKGQAPYNRRRYARGFYCEPCQVFYDEAPEEKPHYGRYWGGPFRRVNVLGACSECHMTLKVAFRPTKEKPDCANCGHKAGRHRNRTGGRGWCYGGAGDRCDCRGYQTEKDRKFTHVAFRYLKTVNGDFRGMVANGERCAIAVERGYAIFQIEQGVY